MREFLQVVGICLHGNAVSEPIYEARPPELLGRTTLFSNTHEIEFIRPKMKAGGSSGTMALGTSRWFKRLQAESVSSYTMAGIPEWGSNGFPEDMGIYTDGAAGSEFWRFTKVMRMRGERDASPYKVVFISERATRSMASERLNPLGIQDHIRLVNRLCANLRSIGSSMVSEFERVADLADPDRKIDFEFGDAVPKSVHGADKCALLISIESLKTVSKAIKNEKFDIEIMDSFETLWETSTQCLVSAINRGLPSAQKAA